MEVCTYLRKPVKHQHAFHDLQMLLQVLYGAVTADLVSMLLCFILDIL